MYWLLVSLFSLCYCYSNRQIVEEVNAKNVGWVAGDNPVWEGKTREHIARLFGWKKETEKPLPGKPTIDRTLAIPTSFVAAQNWPNCKTISTIYDQARCGSCWAFGGVEAAADRFCIATKGAFNQPLSFAEVVECADAADGCEGGSNYAVWSFMSDNGVVTDACYPYYIPTCAPSQEPCLNFVNTPNCWSNNTCVNQAPWKYYRIGNAYNLNSVHDMQNDIMTKVYDAYLFLILSRVLLKLASVFMKTF